MHRIRILAVLMVAATLIGVDVSTAHAAGPPGGWHAADRPASAKRTAATPRPQAAPPPTTPTNRLGVNQSIDTSGQLASTSGDYYLDPSDGYLSLYQQLVFGDGSSLDGLNWYAYDNPRTTDVTHLVMQSDGNLVLYTAAGKALWASRTVGKGGVTLILQDDGNLVLYTAAGKPVWSTATGPSALIAGGKLGAGQRLTSKYAHGRAVTTLIMQTDGNLVLYYGTKALWASHTSAKGASLVMQTDGNLVIYLSSGKAVWSSATNGRGARSFVAVDVEVVGVGYLDTSNTVQIGWHR